MTEGRTQPRMPTYCTAPYTTGMGTVTVPCQRSRGHDGPHRDTRSSGSINHRLTGSRHVRRPLRRVALPHLPGALQRSGTGDVRRPTQPGMLLARRGATAVHGRPRRPRASTPRLAIRPCPGPFRFLARTPSPWALLLTPAGPSAAARRPLTGLVPAGDRAGAWSAVTTTRSIESWTSGHSSANSPTSTTSRKRCPFWSRRSRATDGSRSTALRTTVTRSDSSCMKWTTTSCAPSPVNGGSAVSSVTGPAQSAKSREDQP